MLTMFLAQIYSGTGARVYLFRIFLTKCKNRSVFQLIICYLQTIYDPYIDFYRVACTCIYWFDKDRSLFDENNEKMTATLNRLARQIFGKSKQIVGDYISDYIFLLGNLIILFLISTLSRTTQNRLFCQLKAIGFRLSTFLIVVDSPALQKSFEDL